MELTELIARLDRDRFLELFEYVALTAHGLPQDVQPYDRFAEGAELAYQEILGADGEPRIGFTTPPLMAARTPDLDRFVRGLLAR